MLGIVMLGVVMLNVVAPDHSGVKGCLARRHRAMALSMSKAQSEDHTQYFRTVFIFKQFLANASLVRGVLVLKLYPLVQPMLQTRQIC
jgi:hypothetical protein